MEIFGKNKGVYLSKDLSVSLTTESKMSLTRIPLFRVFKESEYVKDFNPFI